MSYSFRDKPRTRLSDRLRGKSGDELLQELKQEFDKDRKMFFDSNPNWGFTPAGSAFPRRHVFDDDEDDVLRSNSRGRTDLRAHLDDLARRHPEFAEHLRSPPGWVSDFHSGGSSSSGAGGPSRETGGRYFEGTDGVPKGNGEPTTRSETPQQQSSSQPDTDKSNQQTGPTYNSPRGSCSAADRDNLLQHGLRNTDPEIGLKSQAATKEDRNQRSMSAPPDGRTQFNSGDKPQRFVSKIEINPVNPATGETAASFSNSGDNSSGKPPMAPPKHPQQQSGQQPQPKTSNVRHIPIFVEGRDEPVLPKNLDQDFSNVPPSQPHNFSAPQQQPPQSYHYSTPPPQQPAQPQSQQFHPPPPPQPNKQPQPEPQQSHEKFQQSQQQPQASQPTSEKKQKTYNNNDPMYQMQQIQKDLEELRKQIDNYKGASRTDKEYVYLDEMLTRNLIKLDNIETDGKENIRAMRKETIRCVQQCINILESKVPQTPVVTPQTPLEFNATNGENKMDVDENTKSETALTNNVGETSGNSLQQTSSNSKMDTSSDSIVKENTGDSGKNIQVDNTQSINDNKNANASVSTDTSTDAVNKC